MRSDQETDLKELMVQGRFTVKKMSQWRGKLGIAFKGNARERRFLTSVNYGIMHDKISILRTYVEVSASGGIKQAAREAIPFRGGNIVGLVFATSFDVYDFFKKDIGEQNIAEFAGALGVTTLKVAAASFSAIGATATFLAMWGAITSFFAAPIAIPTLIVLGIGAIATIGFGYWFDNIDTDNEYKKRSMAFLKDAFPTFTTETVLEHMFGDAIEKNIESEQQKIDQYIGEQALKGSGMFGF